METVFIKVEFFASTRYVNSGISEVVEIEFDEEDSLDPDYVEMIVEEHYNDWMNNNVNSGWTIKTDE